MENEEESQFDNVIVDIDDDDDEKEPKLGIMLRIPTPCDKEAEDYLYAIQKIKNKFSMNSIPFTEIIRICDNCKIQIPIRQNGLEFKCSRCEIYYDLCLHCQKTYNSTICPEDWGCNFKNVYLQKN